MAEETKAEGGAAENVTIGSPSADASHITIDGPDGQELNLDVGGEDTADAAEDHADGMSDATTTGDADSDDALTGFSSDHATPGDGFDDPTSSGYDDSIFDDPTSPSDDNFDMAGTDLMSMDSDETEADV